VAWWWRWTLLILAVTLADFAVRVATRFNMAWVVPAEAMLFLGTSLALWRLHDRAPAPVRWQSTLQRLLVAAFVLAGLRAALWAGGLHVARANVVILTVGALLLALTVVRSRRSRAAEAGK
jgi:hypothetical protein